MQGKMTMNITQEGTSESVRRIREYTGASFAEIKNALATAKNNTDLALALVMRDRQKDGRLFNYLNSHWTFDSLVEHSENDVAVKRVRAILDRRCPFFLFLHGPSGVGKTHLGNALAHRIHNTIKVSRFHQLTGGTLNAVLSGDLNSLEKNLVPQMVSTRLLILNNCRAAFIGANADQVCDLLSKILSGSGSVILTDIDPPDFETNTAFNKLFADHSLTSAFIEHPNFAGRVKIAKQIASDLSIDCENDVFTWVADRLFSANEIRSAFILVIHEILAIARHRVTISTQHFRALTLEPGSSETKAAIRSH